MYIQKFSMKLADIQSDRISFETRFEKEYTIDEIVSNYYKICLLFNGNEIGHTHLTIASNKPNIG